MEFKDIENAVINGFVGNIEICTNKGFVQLDNLNGKEKILSILNGKPIFLNYKKEEFPFNGDMVEVKLQTTSVLATPNYKFIGRNRDVKQVQTKEAKNISRLSIFANMRYVNDESKLSDLQRLYIAIQADGHYIQNQNDYTCQFHLRKERKIKRLQSILSFLNIKYSYRITKEGSIVISFRFGVNAKNLWDVFDAETIGVNQAKEIIYEMTQWDGYIDKANRYNYASTKKEQTMFFELISVIAGYSHTTSEENGRKENHNKVYKLQVYIKNERNFKQHKMGKQYYKGMISCINIGNKLAVFRKDGKSFIAYDCGQ